MDINDIETGDWSTIYWDKDFGLATALGPVSPGYVWCER